MMDWIDVNNELPVLTKDDQFSKLVLVYGTTNNGSELYEICDFISNGEYFIWNTNNIENVTHWMLLPLPPEIQKKG